jgi:hypothetical protein
MESAVEYPDRTNGRFQTVLVGVDERLGQVDLRHFLHADDSLPSKLDERRTGRGDIPAVTMVRAR